MSPRDPPIPGDHDAETEGEQLTVTPDLEATPSMCYHCFDVLVEALKKNNKKNNNIGSSILQRNSNSNNGGGGILSTFTASQNDLSTTSSANSNNNNNNKPEFVSSLPHETIECPLFVTWTKKRKHSSRHHSHNSNTTTNTTASSRHHHNSQQQQQQQQQQDKHNYELRGCIGTLSPRPLITSIGEYALISALRDKRFKPVALAELQHLQVGVSLLVKYETCDHCHDWIVGVHGVIIRWTSIAEGFLSRGSSGNNGIEYSATYLPEVAADQNWNQKTTIDSLIRKAGYHGRITKSLLAKIQCTRYRSSKQLVTFDEYVRERECDNIIEELSLRNAGNINSNTDGSLLSHLTITTTAENNRGGSYEAASAPSSSSSSSSSSSPSGCIVS